MAGTVRNVYIIQTKSAYIIMTQKHRATIATTTQGRHSRKGERIAENYLETRNKVVENCWRMIVGNDTPKQEDGWLEVMNDRKTENGIANIYNFMYKGRKALTLEEVQGYGANRYFISSGEYTLADYMRAVQNNGTQPHKIQRGRGNN